MSEIAEIRPLTGIRGLAALYVLLFHYLPGVGDTIGPDAFLSHGYLAVDLFFVLSGFVLTLNYTELFRDATSPGKSFQIFLKRRIARVYPLYLVAALCAAVLLSHGWMDGAHTHLKMTTVWNLLLVQSWGIAPSLDSPGWSISAEWAAYLVFPVALWLSWNPTGKRARVSAVVALCCVGLLCCLPQSMAHRKNIASLLDLSDYRGGWPVLRCLPEFLLGVFAARTYAQHEERWNGASGKTVVVAVAAMLLLLAVPRADFLFVALCPVLVLLLTARTGIVIRFLSSRAVHHLGMLSYSIYLVHDLLGGVVHLVHRAANRHGLQHGQTYGAAAAMILVYPLALLGYHFVERPSRRLLRYLLEGGKAKLPAPVGPLGIAQDAGGEESSRASHPDAA